jgi:hypothetical protein
MGPAYLVLLYVIVIANVVALFRGVGTVLYEQDLVDSDYFGLALLLLFVVVVGMVALGGGVFKQVWGPRLYFGTQVTAFLLVLVAASELLTVLSIVPILLAGLLWWLAE